MVKSRLVNHRSIISKTSRLICCCEMKFLQTRQKKCIPPSGLHSAHAKSEVIKPSCFGVIWPLQKKKEPLNNFLQRKLFILFQKTKKIPWAKVKCGKFQAKMWICEHYIIEEKMSSSSSRKSLWEAEALNPNFRLNFGSTGGLIFKPQSANFPKRNMLDLCSGTFLRSLVQSGKGGGLVVLDGFVF